MQSSKFYKKNNNNRKKEFNMQNNIGNGIKKNWLNDENHFSYLFVTASVETVHNSLFMFLFNVSFNLCVVSEFISYMLLKYYSLWVTVYNLPMQENEGWSQISYTWWIISPLRKIHLWFMHAYPEIIMKYFAVDVQFFLI